MTGALGRRLRLLRGAAGCFVAAFAAVGGLHLPRAAAEPAGTKDGATVIVVVGAPGELEYGTNFLQQARLWEEAAARGGARFRGIGLAPEAAPGDRAQLEQALVAEATETNAPLWLVLIGHGTFDGREARFNLRGPDVSAADLAHWLKPVRRPLAVINAASASAPFLNALSATNRVVITATRSGNEQNFARFGEFLARTLSDPQADLDQDGQTSLLESFLAASAQVAEFYKTAGRLATEHALMDDNGDGCGTPGDWFRGVRTVKKTDADAHLDGTLAHQWHLIPSAQERQWPAEFRARRNALELAIASLREKKASYAEDEYYRELERLLLEVACIRQKVEADK